MGRHASIINHIDLAFKDPILFLRAAAGYTKKKVFKSPVLRKLDIGVTFKCNANCGHCCADSLKHADVAELSLDEIKSCISQGRRLGAIAFSLTGGEPLLRPDIYEAIEYIKKNHAIAGLTTNGLLLDKDIICRLKSAGLDVLMISLDSIDAQVHDSRREVPGLFDKVMRAVELSKKKNMKVTLGTIATPQNLSDGSMLRLIDFIQKKNIILCLNAPAMAGRWADNKDILLSGEHKKTYKELLKKPNVRWSGHFNFGREACPCGSEACYITAQGDIVPCGYFQVSYGNIREVSLAGAWAKMYEHQAKINNKKECVVLDSDFVKKYIDPLSKHKKLPVHYTRISR